MTTSISHQQDLSNESVERILSYYGFKSKNLSVSNLTYTRTGAGDYRLECELADQEEWADSITLYVSTSNSNLIDDWAEDETYFEDDNSGHWFDNNKEVFEYAFDKIIEYNTSEIEEFLNSL